MSANPRDAFRSFLDRTESDAWIAGYKWHSADTFGLLRMKLGGPLQHDASTPYSRTHKKGTDGQWWGLEVEAHDGTTVGIDLELLLSRPILDRPEWISRRLGISRPGTPKSILEEWGGREAAFKALAPDNSKILLSQFRRSAPNAYTVFSPTGDRSVQVRTMWSGPWVLNIAWRSNNRS